MKYNPQTHFSISLHNSNLITVNFDGDWHPLSEMILLCCFYSEAQILWQVLLLHAVENKTVSNKITDNNTNNTPPKKKSPHTMKESIGLVYVHKCGGAKQDKRIPNNLSLWFIYLHVLRITLTIYPQIYGTDFFYIPIP